MNWSRVPTLRVPGRSDEPPRSSYMSDDGVFRVVPIRATGYGGKRLKRVVWRLYENGRAIGRPFHSARLAKAFAEAFAAIGDDRRRRAAFLADGAGWCYDKEIEWRHEREAAR